MSLTDYKPSKAYFLCFRWRVVMSKEEMDNMPIWQNHEQRITSLEVTMQGLSQKMDSVEGTMKSVEKSVEKANNEQKEMLNMINTRMVEEFFKRKSMNLSNAWKLIIALFGGGGFIYLTIRLLIESFFSS